MYTHRLKSYGAFTSNLRCSNVLLKSLFTVKSIISSLLWFYNTLGTFWELENTKNRLKLLCSDNHRSPKIFVSFLDSFFFIKRTDNDRFQLYWYYSFWKANSTNSPTPRTRWSLISRKSVRNEVKWQTKVNYKYLSVVKSMSRRL